MNGRFKVIGRGLASVVRRCIEKGIKWQRFQILGIVDFADSKRDYAVKIVDVSTERQSEREAKRLSEETLSEVRLLKLLAGHPSISESLSYKRKKNWKCPIFIIQLVEFPFFYIAPFHPVQFVFMTFSPLRPFFSLCSNWLVANCSTLWTDRSRSAKSGPDPLWDNCLFLFLFHF